MKFFITGSSGFIGKHLVKKLLAEESNVIYSADRQDLDIKHQRLNHEVCDLKQKYDFPDVDVVIHLSAYNGTKFFYEKPLEVIKDNLLPTINLVDHYMKKKLKCFVYAGSPESIAGATDFFGMPLPSKESYPFVFHGFQNKRWSYGSSKSLSEQYVAYSGIDYKIVRYHNVYGPGQRDHFISDFIAKVKNGKPELVGHENTRSFMYIDDAVDATIKTVQSDNIMNEVINLGVNEEIKILAVAKLICEMMKISAQDIVLKDHPVGSVKRRCPDVSKLQDVVGFLPRYTLEKGLRKTIDES
jgi:nucleoside-diphosphate-sugar epimerase